MKWLQANPIGMALAVTSGFFILLALLMTVLWTLPVSVTIDETADNTAGDLTPLVQASEVGELRQYEIINQKPVFNESRLPVIELETEELAADEGDDTGIAVADAPDVKLTGIIITPGMKLASLTPNDASIESVMAYEGDSLTGEFVGWHISEINPRKVVLESRDGQSMELELVVHDSKIQAPIRAVAKEQAKPGEPDKSPATSPAAATADEADEPISRAEQIRQRIAERREELRREQEQAKQSNNTRVNRASQSNNTRGGTPIQSGTANAYQSAIRAKIRNESKDESSDDNEDG